METLKTLWQRPDVRAFATLLLIVGVIVAIVFIVRATRQASTTVAQRIAAAREDLALYDKNYGKRRPLTEVIGTSATRPAGITNDILCLTNFYVATAANAAVYGGPQGIVSTDFIVSYLRAGARCLDFLVLPEDPTDPRAQPIVCDGTQDTRARTTANYITFDDACKTILQQGLERGGSSPSGLRNASDPLFIMLRIRSGQNVPMIQSIADTLARHFAEYRLPYTYYRCARQNTMYADPIENFLRRVIFLSDSPHTGTPLEEYINATFTPSSPSVNALQQTLWTDKQLAVLDAPGKDHLQAAVKQRLTMTVAANPGESVNRTVADAAGVHFTAVDFWKMGEIGQQLSMFKTDSLVLKPAALRYTLPAVPVATTPTSQFNGNGGVITLG